MSILEPVLKFKPERPIYLNESNTGFKTKIEVLFAIENFALSIGYARIMKI